MPDPFDDLLGYRRGHPDADASRLSVPDDTPLQAARRVTAAINADDFGLGLPLDRTIRVLADQHGLRVVEYLSLERQTAPDERLQTGFLAALASGDNTDPFALIQLHALPRDNGGAFAELLVLDRPR